jgi:hypothetical protein
MAIVPYRGNGPAMQDLLAEQIDFMIEPSSNFKALLAAGSVKPFAVTDRTRLPSSPDIPTADEAGLPGFFASLWYGLWVPKGTPKNIIAKLNATMVQVLADPSVKQRLGELGIEIAPLAQQSPEAPACVPEGRGGTVVADHQGVQPQGGIGAPRNWRIRALSLAGSRRVPPMKVRAIQTGFVRIKTAQVARPTVYLPTHDPQADGRLAKRQVAAARSIARA